MSGEIINAPPSANIEKWLKKYGEQFDLYRKNFEIAAKNLKIPSPMFNIINGGKYAGTKLAIQEFMIMPRWKTFAEKLQMACEIYHTRQDTD
jgi:enolase